MSSTAKLATAQQGSIAIIVAVGMVVFLGFAAIVIDLGFGWVTMNELHNIADGASLAATRQLGKIYEQCSTPPLCFDDQQNYQLNSTDRQAIVDAVLDVGAKNQAWGQSITIDPGDIRIGRWNGATRQLTVTDTNPDAVEVTAKRTADSAEGPIGTVFARIWGHNSLSVTSSVTRQGGMWTNQELPTAALTPISQVNPGDIDIPVGISCSWFDADCDPSTTETGFCNDSIKFYPTSGTTGCAGWTTFDMNANANNLRRDIIERMPPFGTYAPPGAIAGQTSFNFIGGNVVTALDAFNQLYESNAICTVGTPTPCLTSGCAPRAHDTRCVNDTCTGQCIWETLVVVYDAPCGDNPGGGSPIPIVGFASVRITDVKVPSEPEYTGTQEIVSTVACNIVEPDTRGGGGNFGTKGSIPGLVK